MARWNIPYLVGDKFHRDHHWVPTRKQSELASFGFSPTDYATYWPVEITLDQIIAMYWRVRNWKLTGSLSVQETGTVPGPIVFNATGTATIDATIKTGNPAGSGPADKESDLIGTVGTLVPPPSVFKFLGSSLGFIPFTENVSSWTVVGDFGTESGVLKAGDHVTAVGDVLFGTPYFAPFVFDPITGMFTPTFLGPGVLIGKPPPAIPTLLHASAQPARSPVTHLSGSGSGNLQAPGTLLIKTLIAPDFTVPLQVTWRFDFQPPTTVYSGSGSLSLTMEAQSFWPYTNTLDEAIYDTVNGTQTGADPFA